MTKEKKKILTNNAKRYLIILVISPQYMPGLIKDIAEGKEACRSSSFPVILKLFKEHDVEVKHIGLVPIHMCTLGCEKKLISKTSIIAIRALKKKHVTWKSLTTSRRKSHRAISKLSVE